jgi:hypothetical protein
MSKYLKEVQPVEKVRHQIIRDYENDGYMIMKMHLELSPLYYEMEQAKYANHSYDA